MLKIAARRRVAGPALRRARSLARAVPARASPRELALTAARRPPQGPALLCGRAHCVAQRRRSCAPGAGDESRLRLRRRRRAHRVRRRRSARASWLPPPQSRKPAHPYPSCRARARRGGSAGAGADWRSRLRKTGASSPNVDGDAFPCPRPVPSVSAGHPVCQPAPPAQLVRQRAGAARCHRLTRRRRRRRRGGRGRIGCDGGRHAPADRAPSEGEVRRHAHVQAAHGVHEAGPGRERQRRRAQVAANGAHAAAAGVPTRRFPASQ